MMRQLWIVMGFLLGAKAGLAVESLQPHIRPPVRPGPPEATCNIADTLKKNGFPSGSPLAVKISDLPGATCQVVEQRIQDFTEIAERLAMTPGSDYMEKAMGFASDNGLMQEDGVVQIDEPMIKRFVEVVVGPTSQSQDKERQEQTVISFFAERSRTVSTQISPPPVGGTASTNSVVQLSEGAQPSSQPSGGAPKETILPPPATPEPIVTGKQIGRAHV